MVERPVPILGARAPAASVAATEPTETASSAKLRSRSESSSLVFKPGSAAAQAPTARPSARKTVTVEPRSPQLASRGAVVVVTRDPCRSRGARDKPVRAAPGIVPWYPAAIAASTRVRFRVAGRRFACGRR